MGGIFMVWANVRIRHGGGRSLSVALLSLAALCGAPALGGPVRVADGQPRELTDLATGEQVILDRRSGPLRFAGREILLEDFIGVAGYASEVAYLLVLSGSAKLAEARARPGRMLLLPPYGGKPMVERFDAGRLRQSWSPAAVAAAPEAKEALDDIAKDQAFGLFAGRYQRTRFNVAASGAAGSEMERRAVVGGAAVREIRFSRDGDPATAEYRVIVSFARALAEGDSASLAELLDPIPFGGRNMGPAGADARLLFARALVAQRDWRRQLNSVAATRGTKPNQWLLAGPNGLTIVTLRPTTDFAFVGAVDVEETR